MVAHMDAKIGRILDTLDRLDIRRDTLYATEAVRHGRWKLLAMEGMPVELFDLKADPTESRNLLAERPAVVARLQGELQKFLDAPRDRSGQPPSPGG